MIPGYPDRRAFIRQTAGMLAGLSLVPDAAEALPLLQGPRLKVGVIGVGRQGRAILAELQKIEPVEIAGICDLSASRLNSVAGQLKEVTAFPDHRAMLASDIAIDAMIVATPTHLHRAIVEDCVAAGKHVFCEAPIAASVEDCEALASLGGSAETITQAGFQGRSNPIYRRAQPLVDAELRQVISAHGRYHRKTSWRMSAPDPAAETAANWRLDPQVSIGLAGEIAAQQFDVAHWFLGRYPTRIEGRGAVRVHRDGRRVPDSIEVDLLWEDGLALRYSATLGSSYGGQYEEFVGAQGSIRLAWSHGWLFKEADAPTQGWEVYATRQEAFGQEGIVLVADATKLAAQGELKAGVGLPHPSLYYALVDFVRSVTESAPVRCTLQEGARATMVGILANRAVLDGTPVAVPVFG